MSKRLIDANELISAMYYYEHNEGGLTAYDAQDIINKAPTIEPKRGEWKWISSTFDRTPCRMTYMCSCCRHEVITFDVEPWEHYCPHCGASMTEREDE